MNFQKLIPSVFSLLFIIVIHSNGQNIIRGIVVDSVSFTALSGAHVTVKNSIQGTSTNSKGFFSINALPTDTLVFSLVGYSTVEIPLLFEEDGFLIRLREKSSLLPEIVIKGTRLSPNDIIRTPRVLPKPMSAGEGIFSPIDYFSKWQREKRKLLKLIQENDRTITYLQVVNDQEVRETIMEEHSLTEQAYYELLVKFNQQSSNVLYSTNTQEIITSLKNFFAHNVR
jgi:CarboxypepD_reg-like domain